MNIAIGAFIDKFNQSTVRGLLTEGQRELKDTTLAMITQDLSLPSVRPNDEFCGRIYDQVTSPNFDRVIVCLLVLQTSIMMSEHFDQPSWLKDGLEAANLVFTVLYGIEIALRILAFGMKQYMLDAFNRLDVYVLAANAFVIPIIYIAMYEYDGKSSEDLALCLRYLRILYVLRFVKRVKGIRIMVATLMTSIHEFLNVFALLLIILFVYSIFGMQLWGTVKYGLTLGNPQHVTPILTFKLNLNPKCHHDRPESEFQRFPIGHAPIVPCRYDGSNPYHD